MCVVKHTRVGFEPTRVMTPCIPYWISPATNMLYYSGILPLALSPQASHPPGRPHSQFKVLPARVALH